MNRKRLRILGILFLLFTGLLLGLNAILESILNRYLQNKLRFQQEAASYRVSYRDLALNIFSQEMQLKDLKILHAGSNDTVSQEPDTQLMRELKIGTARIEGINLANFLWDRNLKIHAVEFDSLSLTFLRPEVPVQRDKEASDQPVLDSLKMPGIKSIDLSGFRLSNFTLNVLEAKSGDTITSFRSKDLRVGGLGLRKKGDRRTHTFVPAVEEMVIQLGRQQHLFWEGLYEISLDSLVYVHKEEFLRIDKFRMEPKIPLDAFATRFANRNFHRMDVSLHAIRVEGLGLHRLVRTGALDLHKVALDSLRAYIFKDNTRPRDPDRDIPLPSRLLENFPFTMSVDTFRVQGPMLSYYEKLPNAERHLETYFTNLEGDFRNIRSSTWASSSELALEMNFKLALLGAINVDLDLELPYGQDAIYLRGNTSGSSDFAALNPTIFPVLNMRFVDGSLDGLTFRAQGNSQSMQGELTMRYSDLEVELFKDNQQQNRKLSWLANTIVRNSNPNRRGKTLSAVIDADRDPTKGVIAYILRGIQSGVVNTFNPLGNNSID